MIVQFRISLSLFLWWFSLSVLNLFSAAVSGRRALSLFPFFSIFCFRLSSSNPNFRSISEVMLTLKFFSFVFHSLSIVDWQSKSLQKKLVAHGERMSVIHTHTRQLGETYLTVEEENDWSKNNMIFPFLFFMKKGDKGKGQFYNFFYFFFDEKCLDNRLSIFRRRPEPFRVERLSYCISASQLSRFYFRGQILELENVKL